MPSTAMLRTITCQACAKTVTRRMRDGQRFCSHPCYTGAPKLHRRTGADRSCRQCGTRFYARKARSGAFLCSVGCANEWQGRRKDSYACKMCGKAFRWSPSRKVTQKPTYCTQACRDADPARAEMLRGMNAKQARSMGPNKLEQGAYAMLDRLGVSYQPQHMIGGRFCVDAFVPDAKLVVQFDGDYWHGHPLRFPDPAPRQQRRMALDRSQDAYMAACGYRVLRLWESDLRRDAEACAVRITAAIT